MSDRMPSTDIPNSAYPAAVFLAIKISHISCATRFASTLIVTNETQSPILIQINKIPALVARLFPSHLMHVRPARTPTPRSFAPLQMNLILFQMPEPPAHSQFLFPNRHKHIQFPIFGKPDLIAPLPA
jgi:hypothetical protein